jgi:peroxiredoxin
MTVTPLRSSAGTRAARPTPPPGDPRLPCSDDALGTLGRARRLARGLVGQPIPEIVLKTAAGRTVELAPETASGAVIYIYPGTRDPSSDRDAVAFDDVAQHGAFDRERDAFRAHSLNVFGLSSEPQQAARMRVLENQVCNHELLSDPELQLAGALGLPTFTRDGVAYHRRLTIVAFAREIAKVFFPVESPSRNAAQVICWLRATGQ